MFSSLEKFIIVSVYDKTKKEISQLSSLHPLLQKEMNIKDLPFHLHDYVVKVNMECLKVPALPRNVRHYPLMYEAGRRYDFELKPSRKIYRYPDNDHVLTLYVEDVSFTDQTFRYSLKITFDALTNEVLHKSIITGRKPYQYSFGLTFNYGDIKQEVQFCRDRIVSEPASSVYSDNLLNNVWCFIKLWQYVYGIPEEMNGMIPSMQVSPYPKELYPDFLVRN